MRQAYMSSVFTQCTISHWSAVDFHVSLLDQGSVGKNTFSEGF